MCFGRTNAAPAIVARLSPSCKPIFCKLFVRAFSAHWFLIFSGAFKQSTTFRRLLLSPCPLSFLCAIAAPLLLSFLTLFLGDPPGSTLEGASHRLRFAPVQTRPTPPRARCPRPARCCLTSLTPTLWRRPFSRAICRAQTPWRSAQPFRKVFRARAFIPKRGFIWRAHRV